MKVNDKSISATLKKIDWVPFLFLTITPIVSAILVPYVIAHGGWHWSYLAQLVFFWALTCFCITGGYHRFLAHRAYEASTPMKLFYLLFGAASFQGSAIKWCSDHRQHHRFVDTEKDPYNINEGFWFAHIGWLLTKTPPEAVAPVAPDLAKDRLVALQDKYYFPLAVIMGFGVPTLVGWALGSALGGLAFGAFLRIVVTHHCTFFINSACHMWGSRPYSDKHSARDSFILALFTYGEGYHNYHHEFQADYRNGIRWYHWDPTKWSIRLLAWAGLARKLKRVAPEIILKARLEQEEKLLSQRGVHADRIAMLKAKVESAMAQWKKLQHEYREFRDQFRAQKSEKFLYMKAELKTAKLEFKAARAQWKTYVKVWRAEAA